MADRRRQTGSGRRRRRRTYSAAEIRRNRAILRLILMSMLFILVCLGVWLLANAYAKSRSETVLSVDSSSYSVLADLPSESEAAQIEKEQQIEEENSIFEQKDSYPLEMIIESPYCVVYDVQGKQVLYAKDAWERCYPASTTKIITAAVMLKYTDEDTIFTAGDEQSIVNEGSSLAYLNVGSVLDRSMILDAIMLPSGNDASYCAAAVTGRIIAENDELTAQEAVDVFIEQMNEFASDSGCIDTNVTCPDGFHDDNHYTTAMDMLRMTLHSEEYPEIAESGEKTYAEVDFLSGEHIWWSNSNSLIQSDNSNYYMYATGLKTGMTDQSGYCVVATAERFGHEIIIVCMGSETSEVRWNDTIALFDAAFQYVRNSDA